MRRCLVARNDCSQGAANLGSGISTASSSWVVENCTVVDNTVGTFTLTDVGGVEGSATVRSSIVRGNASTQIQGASTVTWSNVEAGFPGTGNIDAEPQFVDEVVSRDYHLEPGSPCIDKGDPSTFDPDGTIADIGAFPQADLYVDRNTTPNEWLSPGWSTISALVGGKSVYTFHSKADALSFYGLLGSVTGTTPPTIFLGASVPLVADWYFDFTLTNPSLPPLHDTIGFLDVNGTAHPRIELPPGLINVTSPLTVWHAGLLGDPATSTITRVSNAEAIVIVP